MARVLIVDDEKSIRNTVSEFLRMDGQEVQTAEDANAALALMEVQPFDVVVTDIILPRISGVMLLQRIKERTPDIQVIMMTGEPTVDTAVEAVRAGAYDYLSKPTGKRELLAVVGQAAKVKALLDEKRWLEMENRRYQENLERMVEERTKALADRTCQLEAVREVAAEISGETKLRDVLDLIGRRAMELTSGVSATLFLWDEEGQCLVPKAWPGYGDSRGAARLRLGEGVVGSVAERRQGLVVEDYQTSPYARAGVAARTDVGPVLAEPLLSRGALLGVVIVDRLRNTRCFSAEDQGLLSLFAAQAAIAIENARLFAASERRAAELQALREIDHTMVSQLELPAVLETVVAGTMRLLGTQHAQITLWDEQTQRLRYGAAVGPEAERVRNQVFELGKGINGTVALTRQAMVLNDYPTSPFALPEFADIRSTVTTPILAGERLLGVLHSHATEPGKRFTTDDLHLLQMLATQAAIAIDKALLFTQVARAKAEWERTFDAIPDLVALVDPEHRLLRVNRALAQRLGVSPEALVGQCWYIALHGTDGPWEGCPQTETLATGRPASCERVDPHLGGTFQLTAAGISDAEGRPVGCVYILRDITAMKRLEAEAQERQRFEDLSRAKSAFLANMSHELRTPLNSILGFAQLLQEQTQALLSAKQQRYLGNIYTSGQHLLQLLSDILDLSKVEAGKIEIRSEPLAVTSLVEDILVIARGLANKKSQIIQSQLATDLPPLAADPLRLKQVLFNLLSNAVKFTPDGGTITVAARRNSNFQFPICDLKSGDSEPQSQIASLKSQMTLESQVANPKSQIRDFLEIAVTDTGVGIRPEDLPKLFTEFTQLATTAAQAHEGTGLGLALSKRLVELHGGWIRADSEGEGKGSTFTVLLPLRQETVIGGG